MKFVFVCETETTKVIISDINKVHNWILSLVRSGGEKLPAISKRSGDEPLVKVYFGNIVGMAFQDSKFVTIRP